MSVVSPFSDQQQPQPQQQQSIILDDDYVDVNATMDLTLTVPLNVDPSCFHATANGTDCCEIQAELQTVISPRNQLGNQGLEPDDEPEIEEGKQSSSETSMARALRKAKREANKALWKATQEQEMAQATAFFEAQQRRRDAIRKGEVIPTEEDILLEQRLQKPARQADPNASFNPKMTYDASEPEQMPALYDDNNPSIRRVERFTTSFVPPPGVTLPPLKKDSQSCVLINVCGIGHRPYKEYAGFRIMGYFTNNEEAMRWYNEECLEEAKQCSFFIEHAQNMIPLRSHIANQKPSKERDAFCESIASHHKAKLDVNEVDFNICVDKSRTGNTGQSINEMQKRKMAETSEQGEVKLPERIQKMTKTKTKKLAHVEGQEWSVIQVMRDLTPNKKNLEPLVCCAQSFRTEQEAELYKYVITKQTPLVKAYIVPNYVWLFPENTDYSQIRRDYGSGELGKIMTNRDRTNQEALDFERECTKRGIKPAEMWVQKTDEERLAEAEVKLAATLAQNGGDFPPQQNTTTIDTGLLHPDEGRLHDASLVASLTTNGLSINNMPVL
jgi:hypothetical protein